MPRPKLTYTEAQKEALERLVALGFCRPNSLASRAQIELVWLHVPVEQGGGMSLGLDCNAVATFVLRKIHTITDKDAAMARWHQWVADHNQDVPVPYVELERSRGFSLEHLKVLRNLTALGLCRITLRAKVQVKHVWLKIPVEQLGGLGLELRANQVVCWVKNQYSHRGKFIGDKIDSMAKWEKWVSDHSHLVPPYKYPDGSWSRESDTGPVATPKPAHTPVGAVGNGDSDSPLTDLSDLDIDPTSPVPSYQLLCRAQSQASTKKPNLELLLPVARAPARRKEQQGADKHNTEAPVRPSYHFRNRTELASGKRVCYTEFVTDSDGRSEDEQSDKAKEAYGGSIVLQSSTKVSPTPCPQPGAARVGKETLVATTVPTPDLNPQQRAAIDVLVSHGLFSLTPRAMQQIRQVWSKVAQVGGSKDLNITRPQIQRYLAESGLDERSSDEKQNALIRWENWINKYWWQPEGHTSRTTVRPSLPTAGASHSRRAKPSERGTQSNHFIGDEEDDTHDADTSADPSIMFQNGLCIRRKWRLLPRAERVGLIGLIDLGLCRTNLEAQSQVEYVWQKIPPTSGGGAGLALTWDQIATFIKSHAFAVLNTETSMEEWAKWVTTHKAAAESQPHATQRPGEVMSKDIALPAVVEKMAQDEAVGPADDPVATAANPTIQHKGKERETNFATEGNPRVRIQFTPPHKEAGKHISSVERGALETLMNHGLCRISKAAEEQVEQVWRRDHRKQAVTPLRERHGDLSSKRRRYYDDEGEGNPYSGYESNVSPRAKRSRTRGTESCSSATPDQVTTSKFSRNGTTIDNTPISHPAKPIPEGYEPHLKSLYQPYQELNQEQINGLAELVRLGGCWSTTRDYHLIEKIWMRVPRKFGGGLGLGVPFSVVRNFARSRGEKGFRTENGLARWENWIARNRSNVVVGESLPDVVSGQNSLDAEGDTIMGNGSVGSHTRRGHMAYYSVGNAVSLAAQGSATVPETDLVMGVPEVAGDRGNAANQATWLKRAQGHTENAPEGLVLSQAQSTHANTQGSVSQFNRILPTVDEASTAQNLFAITQDIVKYLNRISPPTPQARLFDPNTRSQSTVAQGDGPLSAQSDLDATLAQTAAHTISYQQTLTSPTPRRSDAVHVQATHDTPPPQASQVGHEAASTPQQSHGIFISQAVAGRRGLPPAQPETAARNPWLQEDGSVRDWYWYPPGDPGDLRGRLFEHWSGAPVPLRQFDQLQTHKITLTIGRDPTIIADVLCRLESLRGVEQVMFHGYRREDPPR